MANFSRRSFLAGCAGVGAAGVLTATTSFTWPELLQAARADPLPHGSGILVLVTLYGGNDGINTLVPLTDDAYHDARPELAYSPDELVSLDEDYGLNPEMTGMAEMFKSKSLAIIRGVGYPEPDRSHFRSMDIWQSGSIDNAVTTGWIGRWLDAGDGDPLRALNIGTVLPRLTVGEKSSAAAFSPQVIPPKNSAKFIRALGRRDPDDTPAMALVRDSYRAVPTVADTLSPLFADTDDGAPVSETGEGSNGLDVQLNAVAQCISEGLPTRVYSVSLGGFDTHSEQRDDHRRLIGILDKAVARFVKRMRDDRYGKNVVVIAYSEFGRRVEANASDGTDHGTAGPVFIAGRNVRGGFYGDEPSLTDLDDGNLKITTDFRDIYGELLSKTLESDPEPVIGSSKKDMGFLKS
ncbi:hypothetical protein MDOR_05770 [Mycolicibacterium doricum]|uniref:DUF1501 domain-containing protein n=1 Tax=Mycolicibacterium doricum TaxID=126673 RepID=A0A1X1T0P7_9MYCO|nr:DUF1501 domain-containing protein [Mycolicibacterium doricum]MCV7268189.1 DUF1501 domain-containing protein [Mycolicibacterium doricum]ORV37807.1 hypothetical protein AWC01_15370 [Mycolicibacterium doricum]BBZ06408.1 hypothetical protein MDOR_05770 [Mycolicibacterium doricum]